MIDALLECACRRATKTDDEIAKLREENAKLREDNAKLREAPEAQVARIRGASAEMQALKAVRRCSGGGAERTTAAELHVGFAQRDQGELFGFDFSDYTTPETLFHMMGHGVDMVPPVRVLDGDWLCARAEELRQCATLEERRALALPRRQELFALHPEAYMSVSCLASLPRGDPRIGNPLPLIVISHMWRGDTHPDPEGDTLLAMADAFNHQRANGRFPEGPFAVFFDWCSLLQRDAAGERTDAEYEAFATAISRMQIWYAHEQTLVYMLTMTPPSWDVGAHTAYHARGWPTFERHVTMINKQQSAKCWANIVDASAPDSEAVVQPPMTVEAFRALLSGKTFTNGADREFVTELYADTLKTAFGLAVKLRYVGNRWGDEDMEQLVKVLPLCSQVVSINFKDKNNKYTAASAAMLAALINSGAMPKLGVLGAGCTEKGSADLGPLLRDEYLQAACTARGIYLLRDADEATVDPADPSRRSREEHVIQAAQSRQKSVGSALARARLKAAGQAIVAASLIRAASWTGL